jgi:hypothetical protein
MTSDSLAVTNRLSDPRQHIAGHISTVIRLALTHKDKLCIRQLPKLMFVILLVEDSIRGASHVPHNHSIIPATIKPCHHAPANERCASLWQLPLKPARVPLQPAHSWNSAPRSVASVCLFAPKATVAARGGCSGGCVCSLGLGHGI